MTTLVVDGHCQGDVFIRKIVFVKKPLSNFWRLLSPFQVLEAIINSSRSAHDSDNDCGHLREPPHNRCFDQMSKSAKCGRGVYHKVNIGICAKNSQILTIYSLLDSSLCLADFIFCVIVLPFSAFRFIQGTWTHGAILCKLIPFIQYGNVGVSLLCIAMITINR